MSETRLGTPVRGSQSGRPIMVLLDLLGRRWALRILWELRHGPLSFRQLRECCDDVSPSSLNQRLRELRSTGLVSLGENGGYRLTEECHSLMQYLLPLHDWAESWSYVAGGEPPPDSL